MILKRGDDMLAQGRELKVIGFYESNTTRLVVNINDWLSNEGQDETIYSIEYGISQGDGSSACGALVICSK